MWPTTTPNRARFGTRGKGKGGFGPLFAAPFGALVYIAVNKRYLHGWRRSGDTRPRRAAIVPCSLRCARDLKGVRPCRAPRPCCLRLRSRSPLRVAAGYGWRGSIRALACGPARGPPAPAGRGAPSPSASAALSLAAAAGGALALLRSGSGCVSSPSPRSASPASAPSPALWAGAAPRASPAALCPASRSRRGGARLSGCRPRWPRWGCAPRRGFVLGPLPLCACGRGVGVPLAAASGDGPPALAGG